MGDEFVFKAVVIKGRSLNLGQRSQNLEVFISKFEPPKTPMPVERSKYALCGKLPYYMPESGALSGVTCEKWIFGRYAIIQNNRADQPPYNSFLELNQVGVYGFAYKDFFNL